jgi:hypothetical protein
MSRIPSLKLSSGARGLIGHGLDGSALWFTRAAAESGFCGGGDSGARAGHRRGHSHLQRLRYRDAASASVSGVRPADFGDDEAGRREFFRFCGLARVSDLGRYESRVLQLRGALLQLESRGAHVWKQRHRDQDRADQLQFFCDPGRRAHSRPDVRTGRIAPGHAHADDHFLRVVAGEIRRRSCGAGQVRGARWDAGDHRRRAAEEFLFPCERARGRGDAEHIQPRRYDGRQDRRGVGNLRAIETRRFDRSGSRESSDPVRRFCRG